MYLSEATNKDFIAMWKSTGTPCSLNHELPGCAAETQHLTSMTTTPYGTIG